MTAETSLDFSDARRQHLEFIQSAIGRMSSTSAIAKGWALTIATATYGYAGTKPESTGRPLIGS
ncbi:hypothetical protein [Cryobacterium sp. Y62]|uniref:hypothetical protein n=1 Tax=Cryobacterium sp. Y62 TaxID=2048284 RepID=UPI000CE3C22C|nr:hypothetical protein [Cryobacterium sp. Y62]